jgi:cytoskeletal protein CcmA (bactofilin family)
VIRDGARQVGIDRRSSRLPLFNEIGSRRQHSALEHYRNRQTGTLLAPAPPTGVAGVPETTLVIKGELTGSQDRLIERRVEGKISLTIGAHATISADVVAKPVIIRGSLTGNVMASGRPEIQNRARRTGDLISPKTIMAEGAKFDGHIHKPMHQSLA